MKGRSGRGVTRTDTSRRRERRLMSSSSDPDRLPNPEGSGSATPGPRISRRRFAGLAGLTSASLMTGLPGRRRWPEAQAARGRAAGCGASAPRASPPALVAPSAAGSSTPAVCVSTWSSEGTARRSCSCTAGRRAVTRAWPSSAFDEVLLRAARYPAPPRAKIACMTNSRVRRLSPRGIAARPRGCRLLRDTRMSSRRRCGSRPEPVAVMV